ncbi:MAG: alcohol dehydrogenase catalytic domain-containing protein, partial [Planctomycetaceae bacterium]|nr:alcohol dehydrogenase catalytic domain-containing protein [Planctomycetaceae bacterium]
MKALLYHEFQGIPSIEEISEPICPPEGAIIRVEATGLCRSDWHGWMGHDDMIQLPHVPGHEFAGIVTAIGPQVRKYQVGQRVTAPFVCGCNRCSYCERGDAQVCPDQTQPGFTHFGSFAERVVVHQADLNLVPLPASMTFAQAAGLGCRFATSYRAVVQQGQLKPQQWLVVFGCGGVGLSAILIGRALNARVLAVDVSESSLRKAQALGAERTLNPNEHPDVIRTIRTWTSGGADVTLDASGHRT